ncbi:glutamine synthetase/guanido kinase [Trametopsis cervina]|nr:glutamine synthetase/guanido kinase [Trametopsis cervina]
MPGTAEHAYGVTYTPAILAAQPSSAPLEQHSLTNIHLLDRLGIEYIRIQWADLTNVVRFRIVPRQHITKLLATARPGVATTKAILGIVGLAVAPGFTVVGEYLYVIDPSSFRINPYAPGHASVMGFFQEKVPHPQRGLTVATCPRTLLKSVVQEAERDAGVQFLVGFETEFILLKSFDENEGTFEAANNEDYTTSAKLLTGTKEAVIVREISDALLMARVELQMVHPEAAPGQYEVITGPLPPLEAADALVFTTETIRNIASKHDYRATLAPRIHSTSCGSGLHAHISVHDTEQKPSASRTDSALAPTLTASERSFLQGVLTHLPALTALTLPTSASYSRMLDGIWAGGTYVVWGSDNREAPLRLCGSPRSVDGTSGGGHHFEVKALDATANPHVALAGLLGIGARAIKAGVQLVQRDCDSGAAFAMGEEERRAFGPNGGEVVRMPNSVEEAREAFKADKEVRALLGEEFVEGYLSVNGLLNESLVGKTENESVAKLLKLY